MSEDNLVYYARRADIERAKAEQSTDPSVARLHAEMARRYEQIVGGADEASVRKVR